MRIFRPAAATQPPAPRRRWPARTVGWAGLLLLAVLLVDGLLYGLTVVEQGQQFASYLANLYARHYLDITNAMLRAHESELKKLNRPEFAALLSSADVAQLNAATQQVLREHPSLEQFDILPLNYQALGLGTDLSFSTQDLINQVLAGQRPAPELSVIHAHHALNVVLPIKDAQGRLAGVICAAFNIGDFVRVFNDLPASDGHVVLMERVGHQGAIAALQAGAGGGDGQAAHRLQSLQPNIWLEFTPGQGAPLHEGLLALFLLLVGLQVVLVAAFLLYGGRRFMSYLQSDADTLLRDFDTHLHAHTGPTSVYHLAPLAELDGKLTAMLAQTRRSPYGPVSPEPVFNMSSSATRIEDIPMPEEDLSLLRHPQTMPRSEALPADSEPAPLPGTAPAALQPPLIDASIFRAYDIRGVVDKSLSATTVEWIGRAIASEARDRGEGTVIVARDGRLSGPSLSQALISGLRAAGVDVIDIGQVPTPVLYYATKTLGFASGVMLTGSHNPPDYNGLKMVLADETLSGEAITQLYERLRQLRLHQGEGKLSQRSLSKAYIDRIISDVALARPLKVVIDCGNGVTGEIAPKLLQALGCQLVPLFTEIDGHFPHHHPDPSKPENLRDLIDKVAAEQADIGLAFDGDGDRLGVVTPSGKIIYPDRLMMLFAKHVLLSHPGADIIFDVKCTRDLRSLIAAHGGRPLMCRTGHSFIKAKLKETQGAFAGEMSGHLFFNDRWYGFDDGLYAAARLLEILSLDMADADSVFAEFPENASTPEINIKVSDESKFAIVEKLKAQAQFADGNVSTLDGLRVDFKQGWGLIRASNTTPVLVARFEGHTEADLEQVKARFRDLLQQVAPELPLAF